MQVIILGAGIIGITTAYFLAKQGIKVTVIEQNQDSSLGCSLANGGQLSYSHIEPWSEKTITNFLFSCFGIKSYVSFSDFSNKDFYRWLIDFYRNSFNEISYQNSFKLLNIAMFSKLALQEIIINESSLTFHHQAKGILHFYRTTKQYQHALKKAEFYQKIRPDYQILNIDQCLNYEPTLLKLYEQQKLSGGILFPQDESGNSKLFTQQLAKICQEKYHVEFLYNTKVHNLLNNKKQITGIHTNKGVFVADKYVYCLGAYSANLLKGININSQIYPMKGYSLSIPCNQKYLAPQNSLTDNLNKIVFSRIGDVFRVAGTLEMSGLNHNKKKSHLNFLYQQTKKTFSHFGQIDKAEEWYGFRPFRPSGLPLTEQNQQYPNLFLNTGHGPLGWTLSFGSGKKLATLIIPQ
jgi:D-amino-acid dehydrogenase